MSLTTNRHAGRTTAGSRRTVLGFRTTNLGTASTILPGFLSLCLLGCLHIQRIGIGDAVERITLSGVAEDILTESLQLSLDTFLLCRQFGGVAIADLRQCLTQHIRGLIDLTLIFIHCEIVVHRHRGSIVQTGSHHGLTVQERLQVAILHPEERILRGLTAEIILTQHDGTERQHLDTERRVGLIVVGALFQIILLNLGRGDVAVVDLQLAILLLIEDMVVVEDGLHLHF